MSPSCRPFLKGLAALCGATAVAVVPLVPAHAAGTVEVSYEQPQQFADIGLGQIDRDRTLETLTQVFKDQQGQLPEGQTLKLQVTDVNLAGRLEFRAARPELRVLRGGADWPSIELRYTLLQDDRVLKSGDARLSDLAYTFGLQSVRQNEPLRYERRMISNWVTKNFGSH